VAKSASPARLRMSATSARSTVTPVANKRHTIAARGRMITVEVARRNTSVSYPTHASLAELDQQSDLRWKAAEQAFRDQMKALEV
jgi:hypothetical protein